MQSIEFLEALRDYDIAYACRQFELTTEEGKYYKRKFKAYVLDSINESIYLLESQIGAIFNDFPYRDYKKQETCEHDEFTIFFKCKCTKVLSENDLDQIIEICQKRKEKLKVGVREFSL